MLENLFEYAYFAAILAFAVYLVVEGNGSKAPQAQPETPAEVNTDGQENSPTSA